MLVLYNLAPQLKNGKVCDTITTGYNGGVNEKVLGSNHSKW